MRAIDVVFAVGWILFWIGWLAAAVGVKSGRNRWGQFAGSRLAIVVVIVLLAHVGAFHRPSQQRDPVLWGIGLALFAAGLAVAVWARVNLGRNWGSPMSQKDNPELVTTGPYRWIRNPIYSGLILAMIGTAVGVGPQWLIIAALVGAYFVYSAVMEQRYMTERFPDTYPAYRDSTKMLIPYVF